MGCYTATKLVIVQGTLDYYSRIKRDPERTHRVEEALLADGDPLVGHRARQQCGVFEKDFDTHDMEQKGKLLKIHSSVCIGKFRSRDWSYILNTDPASEQKTGYEGSNAIYMGRNRFDDYYNDNNHSYTYEQKLDEVLPVAQWCIQPAAGLKKDQAAYDRGTGVAKQTPDDGGLELDITSRAQALLETCCQATRIVHPLLLHFLCLVPVQDSGYHAHVCSLDCPSARATRSRLYRGFDILLFSSTLLQNTGITG